MKSNIHFFITSRPYLLRIRNVSDKSCGENQNKYFVFRNLFFFFRKSCRLWANVEKYYRGETFQNTNLIYYTTLFNMFRAARCSSSGGPIVSPQPPVSSPSVSSRTACGWRADCSPLSTRILYGCLQRVTIPETVVIQLVLLMMSSVLLETSWGV